MLTGTAVIKLFEKENKKPETQISIGLFGNKLTAWLLSRQAFRNYFNWLPAQNKIIVEEKEYVVLLQVDEEDPYILRVDKDEDGSEVFAVIEDDEEFDKVAEAYDELLGDEEENQVYLKGVPFSFIEIRQQRFLIIFNNSKIQNHINNC